jgi:hypothetical protein
MIAQVRWAAFLPLAMAMTLAMATPAPAQPYRWVDEQGHVHYGDRPPPNPPPSLENLNPAARYRPAGEPVAPPVDATPAAPTPSGAKRSSGAATPEHPERGATASRRPDDPELVLAQEILTRSGMDRWLDHLVTVSRNEFGRFRWRLADPQAAWAALGQGFKRETMAGPAAECLAQGLRADDRAAVLEWFRSPLGERARQLRDEVQTPQRQVDYRNFVSRLPDAPPPARLSLVQALERGTRMATLQVEVEHRTRRAVADALRPLLAPDQRTEEVADERSEGEEERMRFHSVTMMLFAYRRLSEGDLQEMARFAASPSGVRFTQLYGRCVRAALTAAEQRAALGFRGR